MKVNGDIEKEYKLFCLICGVVKTQMRLFKIETSISNPLAEQPIIK